MKERKQITLRIPDGVYEALKEEAERMGISTHELIMWAIDYYRSHKILKIDG